MRFVPAILGLLLCAMAHAETNDPLKSDACRQALDAVQRQEAQAAAAPASGASSAQHADALAKLAAQRKEAARICLGSRGDEPLPQHLNQSPIVVPPIGMIRPPPARPLPVVPPPVSMPKLPAPPPVLTGCDAVGCWTSEGKRLDRLGPNLLGPRGQCTVQGTVVYCP